MKDLKYSCNTENLDSELRKVFLANSNDKNAKIFQKRENKWYQLKFIFFIWLSVLKIPHYTVMGMLWYETYLFDEDFAGKILRGKKGKMLDIGAWNGSITEKFIPYIEHISCIEPSLSFQSILRKKWFHITQYDTWENYDIITIFNVFDVCSHPDILLKNALRKLAKNGTMIISLPFPIQSRSWDENIKKTNHLEQDKKRDFENTVSDFYKNFLLKHDLKVISFSRLPYIVSLPESRHPSVYDNGLFVCQKISN